MERRSKTCLSEQIFGSFQILKLHKNVYESQLVSGLNSLTMILQWFISEINKPIYAGMCILEIAKTVVYDFHYNYILKKYLPDRAKLLFTDTDSLTYHLTTEDVYEDMKVDAADTVLRWW